MGVKQGRSNCVEELALTYFACYYMLLLTLLFLLGRLANLEDPLGLWLAGDINKARIT